MGRNLTLDWIDTNSVLGESPSPLSFADAFLPTACRREMIQVGRFIPFRTSRRSLAIQRNIGLILSAGTAREISRLRDGRDHNCAGESEQFKTRVRSRPPSAPSHPPFLSSPHVLIFQYYRAISRFDGQDSLEVARKFRRLLFPCPPFW